MTMQTDLDDEVPAEVQSAVDAAVKDVEARMAADAELVHGDVVEEVAAGLTVEVAVALCQQELEGFVPDTVRQRLWQVEHADTISAAAVVRAEQAAAEEKSRQRSQRAAATRAGTLAAEAAAEKAVLQSKTCPKCFTLRSASGICACDE